MEKQQQNFHVNINGWMDSHLAQIYFNENLEVSPLTKNNYGNNLDNRQYLDFGNSELIDQLSELFTVKKNNAKKAVINTIEFSGDNYDEYASRDDLVDDIFCHFTTYQDFIEAADDSGLRYEKHFRIITVNGYSQGDVAEVIVMDKDYYGKVAEYLHNLYYNAPLSGNLKIQARNGQDYEFSFSDMNIPEYKNGFSISEGEEIEEEIICFLNNRFKNTAAKAQIIEQAKISISRVKFDYD